MKPTLLLLCALPLLVFSCNKDDQANAGPEAKTRTLPNQLASATQIDTITATAVLPLYRGQDASGATCTTSSPNPTTWTSPSSWA